MLGDKRRIQDTSRLALYSVHMYHTSKKTDQSRRGIDRAGHAAKNCVCKFIMLKVV